MALYSCYCCVLELVSKSSFIGNDEYWWVNMEIKSHHHTFPPSPPIYFYLFIKLIVLLDSLRCEKFLTSKISSKTNEACNRISQQRIFLYRKMCKRFFSFPFSLLARLYSTSDQLFTAHSAKAITKTIINFRRSKTEQERIRCFIIFWYFPDVSLDISCVLSIIKYRDSTQREYETLMMIMMSLKFTLLDDFWFNLFFTFLAQIKITLWKS